MGLDYIFDALYHCSKSDVKSIEKYLKKGISDVTTKEFRKWYRKIKRKELKNGK